MFCACTRFLDMFAYLRSPFLLVIRLFWGYMFFKAGYGKLVNMEATAQAFEGMGIIMPYYSALLVGFVEYVGGLMLMVGLLSRFWAFVLSIVMVVALLTAHSAAIVALDTSVMAIMSEGFIGLNLETKIPMLQPLWTSVSMDFASTAPFSFLYMTLIVLIGGPGMLSLDALCCKLFHRKDAAHKAGEED